MGRLYNVCLCLQNKSLILWKILTKLSAYYTLLRPQVYDTLSNFRDEQGPLFKCNNKFTSIESVNRQKGIKYESC